MRSPIKNTENMEFGDVLGEGRYGKVFAARNKKTFLSKIMGKADAPYLYAVKPVGSEHNVHREVAVLAVCKHEHVLECVAIGKAGNGPKDCIITTACYGSLSDRMGVSMHVHHGVLERGFVRKWTIQVLSALAHLHSLSIVHRDVTTSNIFFKTGEKDGDVVLAGFGSAVPLEDCAKPVGTREYFAPELADGVAQGPYTDVWALGMCLYWMCTFQRPPMFGMGFVAKRMILKHSQFQQARAEYLLLRLCLPSYWARPSAESVLNEFALMDIVGSDSTMDSDFETSEMVSEAVDAFLPRNLRKGVPVHK